MVLRYREALVPSGTREVLAAYRMADDGLRRTFAVETSRERSGNRIEARAQLLPAAAAVGKKTRVRGRAARFAPVVAVAPGFEVVIDSPRALGWTSASYGDPPAEDIAPLLLPWSAEKRQRFQFRGDLYLRAE